MELARFANLNILLTKIIHVLHVLLIVSDAQEVTLVLNVSLALLSEAMVYANLAEATANFVKITKFV